MLLFIEDISSESAYAVWHITEEVEELQQEFSEEENRLIENHHFKRKCEYYATRKAMEALCRHMGSVFEGIRKDENGKPFLINSAWHISISHAYPFVTCILHKKNSCGIDIELPREQLIKIQRKFLSEDELSVSGNDVDKLCLFWCAKEALYKVYGKKNLVFAENIKVTLSQDGSLEGMIIVNDQCKAYPLRSVQVEDYFIVFNI